MSETFFDDRCINAIRFLGIDAIEKAGSGHPGTLMGAAPMMYTLWDKFLKHDPANPEWPDRDRFILSAGHASMLLYGLLYLTGYPLTLDDIKQFRQAGSLTPGHPEYGITAGVEASTGPLGQGFANGAGMAIAESILAERYNRPGFKIFDHHTFALVSDGDLQEGVASEAASLAANLKLGKLVYLYDSNGVQQDGLTVSFSENVGQRFLAYGWNVIGPVDGMNICEVEKALKTALEQNEKPSLIICTTIIGFGSPNKAGTNAAHGEPLGSEEVRLTREKLGWTGSPFVVPEDILEHFRQARERGAKKHREWKALFEEYKKLYPQQAAQLVNEWKGELPVEWQAGLAGLYANLNKKAATRDTSGSGLAALADKIPALIGGSADLAGSTRTYLKRFPDFTADNRSGRNIHYGLREHAMGAISSGIALHGGLIPFASTFLVFSDYMRPAIRLAALMKLHVIYILTHDSIGLGEDGPTHQPVEQLTSLRAIPGLVVLRPADAVETIAAWEIALEHRHGPSALILTRQAVPPLPHDENDREKVRRGAYVLADFPGSPRILLIGTGSEVHPALEAAAMIHNKGIGVRVVSMPSWELFEEQPQDYKNRIFPPDLTLRISVEAGSTMGWQRYTGLEGKPVGVDRFGISAPGKEVLRLLDITADRIVREVGHLTETFRAGEKK